MRSAILQLPESRSANEQRQVLRTAMRQLERADLYLAAVAYMELGGPAHHDSQVAGAASATGDGVWTHRRRG